MLQLLQTLGVLLRDAQAAASQGDIDRVKIALDKADRVLAGTGELYDYEKHVRNLRRD